MNNKFSQYLIYFCIAAFSISTCYVLFIHHLGSNPLFSYDEAWYASIARNMSKNSAYLYSSFNGSIFTDHPPLGLWLMNISMRLFGASEFAARLSSALCGILSLLGIYLLSKKRVSKINALIPVTMLASSLWFIYRSRSGNLDVPLLCFYIYSIYFFELWQQKKTTILLISASVLISCLLLTKTLVGFSIFPVLLIKYYLSQNRPIFKYFIALLLFSLLLILPWYLFNYLIDNSFLSRHFIGIGTRENSFGITQLSFQKFLLYLRSGIGKWYLPSLAAVSIAVISFLLPYKQKLLILNDLIWLFIVTIPFMLSLKTEVWHLLPIYIPLFIIFISVFSNLVIPRLPYKNIIFVIFLVFITSIGWMQGKSVYAIVTQPTSYAEADIALKSRTIDGNFYLKIPYLPSFVYYSEKEFVYPLWLEKNAQQQMELCLRMTCSNIYVINSEDLKTTQLHSVPFQVLTYNKDYYVISSIKE